MKKVLATAFAIVATFAVAEMASATSNINTFKKGDLGLNVNFHLGTLNDEGMAGISAVGEYGILNNIINEKGSIGVGAQIGCGWSSEKLYSSDLGNYKIKNSVFRIATRGVLHYQFIPQLDTYAGLSFGIMDFKKYKTKGAGIHAEETDNSFIFAPFAGVRYMLSSNFGFTSEVAFDEFTWFSIGVAFKF